MIPALLALAAGAQAVGSGIAAQQKADADGQATGEREQALQLWAKIQDPHLRELLAPYIEKSAMEDVSVDPRLKDAQMMALSRLQEQGLNGGMTAEDRQMAQDARNQSAQYEQGQRNALMQNFAQRGAGGSGMELASQLAAQQGGANRMNAMSMDQAANAQRRALQAIQQSGQLGGQMRGQDFDEQSQKARAKDAISQLNAGYNMWQQTGNNQNHMNLANYRMSRVAGQTGQYNQNANAHNQAGAESAALWSGIGQAGAQTAGSLADYYKKKDEK
jgi:hypothetical protein